MAFQLMQKPLDLILLDNPMGQDDEMTPFIIVREEKINRMTSKLKERIRQIAPWCVIYFYKKLRSLPEDLPVLVPFLFKKTKTPTTFLERLRIIYKCYRISYSVESPHMENEMVRVISAIFSTSPDAPGVIVEAGSYKGGSTAKLSLAASLAGQKINCL